MTGFEVVPKSLHAGADILTDLAAALHAGRPATGVVAQTRTPYCHAEVADAVQEFTAAAADRYAENTAVIAALVTKLHGSADACAALDWQTAQNIEALLRPPVSGTGG